MSFIHLPNSLPLVNGAARVLPLKTIKDIMFEDPRHRIKPQQNIVIGRKIKIGKPNQSKFSDKFVVATTTPLQPIQVAEFGHNKIFDNVEKKLFFQPMVVMTPPTKPPETLTNMQVALINSTTDPTQKWFLLSMFENKVELTQSLKQKMLTSGTNPIGAEEKKQLDLATYRLQQKYIGLNNTNTLNALSQDR